MFIFARADTDNTGSRDRDLAESAKMGKERQMETTCYLGTILLFCWL